MLEIQPVYLEHDAVDFIGQAVTLFHQLVVGLQAVFRTLGLAHFRVDTETPVGHQLKAVPVGVGQHTFVRYCHAVGAELQRAPGGDGRFLLAQAAGGGITRVHKGLLVLLGQPLVQLLEPGFGHVHLATHLYQLRIAAAPKLQRYRRNRSDVGGDVFSGVAITPGGSAGQQSVLVMQADRKAIELGFADVFNGVFGVQAVADPAIEVPQFVFAESVVQRQHRQPVGHFGEAGVAGAAYPAGGRVVRGQLRMFPLQLLELPEQPVVFRIGDSGLVQNVVVVIVVFKIGA